ncbi:hypothetical protein BOTBODRAFT_181427 [Botryobasidium botryosum FD-172 SS1]|uniref:Uncharacterized protein n=1 Tax=Botryobasidium botryosum (strain FD-172 SS1) TaxID=930990 RepID=A0A067LU20_BOTB1|nr:hypothetical protein BOTBODRAFT_181427 [Botryobasidium botryosum FD-172 SS1]
MDNIAWAAIATKSLPDRPDIFFTTPAYRLTRHSRCNSDGDSREERVFHPSFIFNARSRTSRESDGIKALYDLAAYVERTTGVVIHMNIMRPEADPSGITPLARHYRGRLLKNRGNHYGPALDEIEAIFDHSIAVPLRSWYYERLEMAGEVGEVGKARKAAQTGHAGQAGQGGRVDDPICQAEYPAGRQCLAALWEAGGKIEAVEEGDRALQLPGASEGVKDTSTTHGEPIARAISAPPPRAVHVLPDSILVYLTRNNLPHGIDTLCDIELIFFDRPRQEWTTALQDVAGISSQHAKHIHLLYSRRYPLEPRAPVVSSALAEQRNSTIAELDEALESLVRELELELTPELHSSAAGGSA